MTKLNKSLNKLVVVAFITAFISLVSIPIRADNLTDYNNLNPLVQKCKIKYQSDGTPKLNPDGSVMQECRMVRTYPNWFSYDQYLLVIYLHRYHPGK